MMLCVALADFLQSIIGTYLLENKNVLLRERKRHTSRRRAVPGGVVPPRPDLEPDMDGEGGVYLGGWGTPPPSARWGTPRNVNRQP